MNRLLLVGNGFDLAHGLKTGYKDFVRAYLHNVFLQAESVDYEDNLLKVRRRYPTDLPYLSFFKGATDMVDYFFDRGELKLLENSPIENVKGNFIQHFTVPFIVEFHSEFFLDICQDCYGDNWVDIENGYYTRLKKILKIRDADEQKQELRTLNIEMEDFLKALVHYLQDISDGMGDRVQIEDFLDPHRSYKKGVGLKISPNKKDNVFVLNFNYTNTVQSYFKMGIPSEVQIEHIHGNLKGNLQNIVFGVGDETDSAYLEMEDHGNTDFLKYVKSFYYFHTKSYDKLLNFITTPFTIHILGHSCGTTDRVLLKMLFEHQNCKLIDIIYYKISDSQDNYTQLTHSIARHFSDKVLMRERIVNKLDSKYFL